VDCHHLTKTRHNQTIGADPGPHKGRYVHATGATVVVAPVAWCEAWCLDHREEDALIGHVEPRPDGRVSLDGIAICLACEAWADWIDSQIDDGDLDPEALEETLWSLHGITGQDADSLIVATISAVWLGRIAAGAAA